MGRIRSLYRGKETMGANAWNGVVAEIPSTVKVVLIMTYSKDEIMKGLDRCYHLQRSYREEIVDGGFDECFSCPFRPDGEDTCNTLEPLFEATIELLKAQVPILLENQHKPYGHFINANSPWISRCPKCGKKIEGKQTRFCKYCGQAVKWEWD